MSCPIRFAWHLQESPSSPVGFPAALLHQPLQYLINNADARGVTKIVPVFITLTPSVLFLLLLPPCGNWKSSQELHFPEDGKGVGWLRGRQANPTAAVKAIFRGRLWFPLGFNFVCLGFFPSVKKKNGIPGFAPMEKHHLYDLEKKSCASSSSLINTWESRPGWGNAGRKHTSYSAVQVINLRI